MPDVDELRKTLLYEEIAKRLAAGDTARTIGRDLNERPDALREILASDEFLEVLRDHDRDLAEGIAEERDAAKPLDYEALLMAEAEESVKVLMDLRDGAEDDKIRIAAATALVNVAEKVKKVHVEKTTVRVTLPKKQLDALMIAGQEVDALDRYAEPAGATSNEPSQE